MESISWIQVDAYHGLKTRTGIFPARVHVYFRIFNACHPHAHVYSLRTFYLKFLANHHTRTCTAISSTTVSSIFHSLSHTRTQFLLKTAPSNYHLQILADAIEIEQEGRTLQDDNNSILLRCQDLQKLNVQRKR